MGFRASGLGSSPCSTLYRPALPCTALHCTAPCCTASRGDEIMEVLLHQENCFSYFLFLSLGLCLDVPRSPR